MEEEDGLHTHEAIVERFTELRAQSQQLAEKTGNVAAEQAEYEGVLKALEKLDPKRRCFRQVGGVLVERTVGEVIPAVKDNKERLVMVSSKLTEQLKSKNKELTEFQAKYKIRVRTDADAEAESGEGAKSEPIQKPAVLVS